MQKIAIIGAGVAGSYLAWKLSKEGFQITVFDPQRYYKKACGESVPKGSLPSVISEKLNLSTNYIDTFKILVDGAPVKYLEFKKPLWTIIDKANLVNTLRDLSRDQGAKYLWMPIKPKKIINKFNVIVDSRGPYSNRDFIIAFRVIVKAPWRENLALIDFRPKEGGLYWIFPHRKNFVNAGGGFIKLNISENNIISYLKKIVKDVNIDIIDARAAPIAINRNINLYNSCNDNYIIKVGEAAGLINSTSGEGIRHAFISAQKLYDVITSCNENYLCVIKKYDHALKELKKEVILSRKLLYISLRNSRTFRDFFKALPYGFWKEYLSGRIKSPLSLAKNILSYDVIKTLGLKNLLDLYRLKI